MARRKDQEQARRVILDAALTAVSDRGVGKLKIREVAESAGVSPATVHYYFDDLDNLLREVHRDASDRFFGGRLAMVARIGDARAKIGALIWAGLPASDSDELVVALYRLAAYRSVAAEHGDRITALFEQQVAVYLSALEVGIAQGHFTIDAPILDVAANLVALEDAYGLHIVSRNRSITKSRAAELICSYARTATGCADITTPEG
ncbi:TetR/AcrR family transcriptional regulator [Nocardia brasiliensis]|uniref:TetR family transcriptional regulator n=1 Tax=Nocardia brasiliensis (strain ATCC 700358 / HUJEG-1) TaxID=1133849 RepID=K0EY32_NOCB7|nr:TetR/AcrR family transcriptional regulator [Nocardia brasiliensis]AFU02412.1 TetR family transcriptional regulator [Nocardia brasiliensis ATCC 700358]OCF85136.1 TetR family transcriptional regulator [Nocardia brasiliensis]